MIPKIKKIALLLTAMQFIQTSSWDQVKEKICIMEGSIEKQWNVDAIVNASNSTLLGGGGVDGAIHKAAGQELQEYCRQIKELEPGIRCQVGQVVITPSFDLCARGITYIIHTVGPHGDDSDRKNLLCSCYQNCLQEAAKNGIKSIAFPSISTGIYRYPLQEAAQIALETVHDFLQTSEGQKIQEVRFVLWNDGALAAYQKAYEQLD